jgi:hypothetical protein
MNAILGGEPFGDLYRLRHSGGQNAATDPFAVDGGSPYNEGTIFDSGV